MRGVVLLLVLLPLLPLQAIRAQDLSAPPATSLLTAVPPVPGTVTVSGEAFDFFALPHPTEAGRDRVKGALYGSVIGAVVGGVGFAAVTFIANRRGEGEGYWPLGLLVGSVPGGAVGLVVGAIIGAPKHDNAPAQRAQLLFTPGLRGGGAVAVSVSFRSR